MFLQSLADVEGSCGLFDLAGLGTAMGMLPACLAEGQTRKRECAHVSCTCFCVLLKFDAKV